MQLENDHLVWVDLEMTGLDPDTDRIIEIASIVTDANLAIIAEGPVIAIATPEDAIAGMDAWNTEHHTASGLVDRIRESEDDLKSAQQQTIDFLSLHVDRGQSPMCGNSICQDRRFMVRGMPELELWFHYRNIDVSTVKELIRRWSPETLAGFQKRGTHKAMDDIKESIEELRFYRKHVFSV